MWTSSIIVLAALAGGSASNLEKYVDYMKEAKELTVDVTVTAGQGGPAVHGLFEMRKPNMQRYVAEVSGVRFEFRQHPSGTLVLEHSQKLYERLESPPRLARAPGSAGIASMTYPYMLLISDLRKIGGSKTEFKPTGPLKIGAIDTEGYEAVVTSMMAKAVYRMWLTSEGQLRRAWVSETTPQGSSVLNWDFTSYKLAAPVETAFRPTLPWGYSPRAITPEFSPLVAQEKAPFGYWVDARTGKKAAVAKLASGKTVALLFTAPDCKVSASAEASIRSIEKKLDPKSAVLWEVSLGKDKPKLSAKNPHRPVFWDKDGAIEKGFRPMGTPYLFIVDAKGLVKQGWYGFDADRPKDFVDGVLKAIGSK